jgi:hypothetical protein
MAKYLVFEPSDDYHKFIIHTDVIAYTFAEAVEEAYQDPEGNTKTQWFVHKMHEAAAICKSDVYDTVLVVRIRE